MPVSRSFFWSDNPWDWGITKQEYHFEIVPRSFYQERKTVEDETVKIDCRIWDCEFNLWQQTEKSHCKLKYINIGVRVISDYPHGIEGSCTNMKIRRGS
jgi:hypothetical protein